MARSWPGASRWDASPLVKWSQSRRASSGGARTGALAVGYALVDAYLFGVPIAAIGIWGNALVAFAVGAVLWTLANIAACTWVDRTGQCSLREGDRRLRPTPEGSEQFSHEHAMPLDGSRGVRPSGSVSRRSSSMRFGSSPSHGSSPDHRSARGASSSRLPPTQSSGPACLRLSDMPRLLPGSGAELGSAIAGS